MLGWEFPPFISGGLGTACYGPTKAMSRRGDRVLFVMPGATTAGFSATSTPDAASRVGVSRSDTGGVPQSSLSLPDLENVTFRSVGSTGMSAYGGPMPQQQTFSPNPPRGGGGRWSPYRPPAPQKDANPVDEVARFTTRAVRTALDEQAAGRRYDVVHAHDWTSLDAGRAIARHLRVPLVAHVHSTEFDRNGENADPRVIDAEAGGLAAADAIIAVSEYTAAMLRDRYGIDGNRIRVVHNAADATGDADAQPPASLGEGEPVVLFVGRLTRQKNPIGFIRAAAKVVEQMPRVRFVVAGSGELDVAARALVDQLGLEHHFLFAGFLNSEDVERLYAAADLLVMPSLSEPFGLVATEAMRRGVPVIAGRDGGLPEVAKSIVLADGWDEQDLADKVVQVLGDDELRQRLGRDGKVEVRQMRWSDAAEKVAEVYSRITR